MTDWQSINTAPKPKEDYFDDQDSDRWIMGYTSWGQHVGKFHEWVGPCEWQGPQSGWQFANAYADVFPAPTHWSPWPKDRPADVVVPVTAGERE